MRAVDSGLIDYRAAWRLQERAHAAVVAGEEEQLLLVEHPPVITLGRRPGLTKNILATNAELIRRQVEIVESDRGGDITFHGPGQLVAYPIVRLAAHQLSVSGYVHRLENIIIELLQARGIDSYADPTAIGVWTQGADPASPPAKIGAIGVRIRRGVTMHGLALNVSNDLSYFNLIIPCGLQNRSVTSLAKLLPANPPLMAEIKEDLRSRIIESFAS